MIRTPEYNDAVSNPCYIASNFETINGYFTLKRVNGNLPNLNLFSTPTFSRGRSMLSGQITSWTPKALRFELTCFLVAM